MIAIDQKGGGPALQETRLYTFADSNTKTLYLITVGDKNSQSTDINFCSDFVRSLQLNQE